MLLNGLLRIMVHEMTHGLSHCHVSLRSELPEGGNIENLPAVQECVAKSAKRKLWTEWRTISCWRHVFVVLMDVARVFAASLSNREASKSEGALKFFFLLVREVVVHLRPFDGVGWA
jgi:hypothetical protein